MSNFSPFFKKKAIRDERKDHRAVDEFSSEQLISESDDNILIVRKNWNPRPSATCIIRLIFVLNKEYTVDYKLTTTTTVHVEL